MKSIVDIVPSLGFSYEEEVTGELSFLENPLELRRVKLKIRVVASSLARLALEPTVDVGGVIDIEGVADHRPISGTVAYRFDEKRVPYLFSFTADDGRQLSFRAQKDFNVFRLSEFVSRLDGTLYDEVPSEVARVSLRRPVLQAAKAFVKSFRLKL